MASACLGVGKGSGIQPYSYDNRVPRFLPINGPNLFLTFASSPADSCLFPKNGDGPYRLCRICGILLAMDEPYRIARSPDLMTPGDTALLVVDVQEKLVPALAGSARVVWNARRLIDGARVLGVPVVATEQYPQGLGRTVPELAQRLGEIPSKQTFSCGGCPAAMEELRRRAISKVLVCGIEAHVCVQQTVLDLLADGWRIYVAVDAIGSRFEVDYQTALRRMDSAGATLTTTEAALFEWCQVAGTPEFKEISRLAREAGPATC